MRKLYIEKPALAGALQAITKAQTKANAFINVTVKPYTGKKYDLQNTVVIKIG